MTCCRCTRLTDSVSDARLCFHLRGGVRGRTVSVEYVEREDGHGRDSWREGARCTGNRREGRRREMSVAVDAGCDGMEGIRGSRLMAPWAIAQCGEWLNWQTRVLLSCKH